ncbi:DUF4238 domain-containing protein [Methyloceanibacter sp.]|uniref:DUF4238 domain-containing protein n=1 Tax=Methyloceanibacter sp. TaxID=1965321 RepID=UPI003D6CB276
MGTKAHTVPKFYLRGFVAPESENRRDPYVWIASLTTGKIARRSPKNISTVRGLYDGRGGLAEPDASIEAHLSKIESAASTAIRSIATGDATESVGIPPEVWRFLAWQAARAPGYMKLVQAWANEPLDSVVVEEPPPGFEEIGYRTHPSLVEDPASGERREVDADEFDELRKLGWRWILRTDDRLEALHIQAWYFQVRHFPRLSWVWLSAPHGESFITGDRGVVWLVDGYADAPPAALQHPTAQVVAPLTREVALVGRHTTSRLDVTTREVNRLVAFASADWIAGPTREAVEQALTDRRDPRH